MGKFYVLLQIDAPDDALLAVKETLAMYCEKYDDTKIVSITEEIPNQIKMGETI